MEVNVVSGSWIMKQAKINLANTQEYHWAWFLERMSTTENCLKAMAVNKSKSPSPVSRGQGYTW